MDDQEEEEDGDRQLGTMLLSEDASLVSAKLLDALS